MNFDLVIGKTQYCFYIYFERALTHRSLPRIPAGGMSEHSFIMKHEKLRMEFFFCLYRVEEAVSSHTSAVRAHSVYRSAGDHPGYIWCRSALASTFKGCFTCLSTQTETHHSDSFSASPSDSFSGPAMCAPGRKVKIKGSLVSLCDMDPIELI